MSTSGKATESNETKLKSDIRVEFFHGERAKLRAYLMQIKLVHALDPSKYASETNKVLIAATYLRGDAQSWFEPYFSKFLNGDDDEEAKRIFSKFAYYENKLKQVFGSMDEERVAARQLRQLRQKGSAAQYYSRFQQLSARLDWDDAAFASAYYEGLSEAVKDEMGIDPPQSLKKLVDVSIKTDGWLFERRMEKRGGYSGYSGYSTQRYSGRGRRDHGDPMDLDLMEHGRSSRPNKPRFSRGSGGTNKEREKRRRDNLCFNCGKSGHRARECSSAAQGLHMMNEETGIEEKKADTSMETSKADDSRGSAQKGPISADELLGRAMGRVAEDLMALKGTLQAIQERPETVQEGTISEADRAWLAGEIPLRPHEKEATSGESHRHALLTWTACYQDYCPVHYSSKNDSGWFPREPRSKNKEQQDEEDQESLSMMKKEQPAEKVEASHDTDGGDADNEREAGDQEGSDEETEGIPQFIASRITKEGFNMITNWWRRARCQSARCERNGQHLHTIFDPETEYKRDPQMIYIEFCTDEECEHKDNIHAHQGNDDTVMEITIPDEVVRRIWGSSETSSLSAMCAEASPSLPTTEERANKEYMSQDFECLDIGCPLYIMTHNHARNIDPDHPGWGFTPRQYQAMIDMGMTCEDERCQWSDKGLHVHASLIGTQNISSMDDEPTNVWPYIDDRADTRYLYTEFGCTDINCPVYFTEHHHLLNIDPTIPDWEIRPTHYQAMIDDGWTCGKTECAWKNDLHVHYQGSKNE
jgi:Retrotransposon gag protein/Zinc knuckle